MSTGVRSVVSVVIAVVVFAIFWPTFFWIAAAPAALLGIIVWLASGQDVRTRQVRQFALTGSVIGLIVGGAGVFLLILITGWGTSEGWEGLQAIAGGMVGAFSGAVVGLVVGGVAGAITDRKRPENHQS